MADDEVQAELISEGEDLDASPRGVNLTEREIQAVELRKAGYSFGEIAEALGWGHRSSAMRAVRRALQRWGSERVDEYRILELSRLDTITKKLWPLIVGQPAKRDNDGTLLEPARPPDLEAMKMYLSVSTRRARLLGLDAPQAVDLTFGQGDDGGSVEMVESYEQFTDLITSIAEQRAGELPAPEHGNGQSGGPGGEAGGEADEDSVLPPQSD